MTDPLAPFIQVLARTALPLLIFAIVIGGILGLLARGTENWLVRLIRGFRKQAAARSHPSSPKAEHVPNCPICNGSMVLRPNRRAQSGGNHFWGCSNYPPCRGTRSKSD